MHALICASKVCNCQPRESSRRPLGAANFIAFPKEIAYAPRDG